MSRFWAIVLLWSFPFVAWGLLPLQTFQDLAAGEASPGYADGPFYSARFNCPQGIVFNPEGTLLYVADRENHCIRVVDLEHGNQVSTLTGKGKPGFADGSLSDALFNRPTALVYLPNRQIVVSDEGNFLLRLIDLNRKTVTTLAGNKTQGTVDGDALKASVGLDGSMVYLPSRDGLYFSQPIYGVLRKLDLKTRKILTVFRDKPDIPNPDALAEDKGKLYVADQNQDQVFELTPKEKFTQEDEKSFDWSPFTKGKHISNMAWSGNVLYAVQKDRDAPLVRLTPQYQPITFVSIWGDSVTQYAFEYSFFMDVDGPDPIFLAADPVSDRKLYISHPAEAMLTSYRDLLLQELKFAESNNADGLTDFQYPTAKPPGTFRVLLIGDSHTFHQFGDDIKKGDGSFITGSSPWQNGPRKP